MITHRGKIQVDSGIEYITQWIESGGHYVFDRYLYNGKLIVNKKVTGCGFTTYCLLNDENTILVSPRRALIKNKMEDFEKFGIPLFYYNREGKDKPNKSLNINGQLANQFQNYCEDCTAKNRRMKILVTYDSFSNLATMMEQQFHMDISRYFRIVIDESHTIVKDVKLKEYSNKCVLSSFLQHLFHYEKLLFISATPIIDYIQVVPEFKDYSVDYIELDWPNISPVTIKSYGCKNSTHAFDQVYTYYSDHMDPDSRHYFDTRYDGEGKCIYSYECVVFLNSVLDISRIVKKYVNKLKLIDISDITVICADTVENKAALHKTNMSLNITTSIPKKGEKHRTWTFVTRTAFEGVDFCSPCASTYVVANYNVECLSLDIASDIPQIIGRQRLKENAFRDILNIYYTNNLNVIDEDRFHAWQKEKMETSRKQIDLWTTTTDEYKNLALRNLTCVIENKPNDMYVKTVNGFPEIDQLIIVSENYCMDVLKNQISWYNLQSSGKKKEYSFPVLQLKEMLNNNASGIKKTQERIKYILDCFSAYPMNKDEIFYMLYEEGYGDIADYFINMPIDRIKANACDPWKMSQELKHVNGEAEIKNYVTNTFTNGIVYSKKEVKSRLQEIYDKLGINKTAKANELPNYISCIETTKDGIKAYRITKTD